MASMCYRACHPCLLLLGASCGAVGWIHSAAVDGATGLDACGESTALSPLPLISSYKSEKFLCGTGVLRGDNSSCLGCDGEPNGVTVDYCGECGGDGSTCASCNAYAVRWEYALLAMAPALSGLGGVLVAAAKVCCPSRVGIRSYTRHPAAVHAYYIHQPSVYSRATEHLGKDGLLFSALMLVVGGALCALPWVCGAAAVLEDDTMSVALADGLIAVAAVASWGFALFWLADPGAIFIAHDARLTETVLPLPTQRALDVAHDVINDHLRMRDEVVGLRDAGVVEILGRSADRSLHSFKRVSAFTERHPGRRRVRVDASLAYTIPYRRDHELYCRRFWPAAPGTLRWGCIVFVRTLLPLWALAIWMASSTPRPVSRKQWPIPLSGGVCCLLILVSWMCRYRALQRMSVEDKQLLRQHVVWTGYMRTLSTSLFQAHQRLAFAKVLIRSGTAEEQDIASEPSPPHLLELKLLLDELPLELIRIISVRVDFQALASRAELQRAIQRGARIDAYGVLPTGWKIRRDEEEAAYYYNRSAGVTSWGRPTEDQSRTGTAGETEREGVRQAAAIVDSNGDSGSNDGGGRSSPSWTLQPADLFEKRIALPPAMPMPSEHTPRGDILRLRAFVGGLGRGSETSSSSRLSFYSQIQLRYQSFNEWAIAHTTALVGDGGRRLVEQAVDVELYDLQYLR